MNYINIYDILEVGTFRILELNQYYPAETQLSRRLISSRLEDTLGYYAISYVWGNQQPTSSILLGCAMGSWVYNPCVHNPTHGLCPSG